MVGVCGGDERREEDIKLPSREAEEPANGVVDVTAFEGAQQPMSAEEQSRTEKTTWKRREREHGFLGVQSWIFGFLSLASRTHSSLKG